MRLLSLALLALVLLAAPAAEAAPWKRVTTPDLGVTDQPGLVRTPDGVLHLAWQRSDPAVPNSMHLNHTAITAGGRLGATATIAAGWNFFQNPALVVDPAGLRVFAPAIRSTTPSEKLDEISTFLSTDGGTVWTPGSDNIVPDGGQAAASPVAAAVLPSGEMLQTWAGTLGTWVHSGLLRTSPIHDYQKGYGQYGYNPNIAADATGTAMLAWYSSGAAKRGVLARGVAPGGAPAGDAETMPGTGGMTSGMIGLTPLAARAGGGIFIAYPVGRSVWLWRVGDDSAQRIARTRQGSRAVTVAATSDGRLWVAWVRQTLGGPRLFATRSNRSGTFFGTVVSAGRPRGSAQGNNLGSSATSDGRLDVLANFQVGATSEAAVYYRRLLPGLTLVARPRRLRRDVPQEVRFTVLDAGDPVSGARVRVGGISGRTGQNGTVTLELPARSATARATKRGYVRATTRLRLVRRR